MARIAINGFGRIGRCLVRAAVNNGMFGKGFDLVVVNDLSPVATIAHLLKHDSVHGAFDQVTVDGPDMVIAGRKVKTIMEKDDSKLPWKELNVDVVIDCTGKYTERALAQKHLTQGAKKVLVSAPGKECDATLVMGVNFNTYDKTRHNIISMASCTTGSMAPVVKTIDEAFGIKRGFMTTCHAYTMDQKVLDGSHKDLRRARASAVNIIPTSTGAAKAIGEVVPSLKGKMNGLALRVPVPDGSVTDMSLELGREVSADEVNAAIKAAAEGPLKGILEYSTEPLVSTDIIGNPNSAIFDALSTMVIPGPDGKKGSMVKLLSWYDNEYGYSCRVVEMASRLV
jgi:glyceraldehyde 3-phosphate dehydrogenase